jgi:type II secretory pathway component PulK
MLLILLLLGVLVAMFSFRVNADVAATRAVAYRLQTRLAAEAGIERVKLLLREARLDTDVWYHNPDELHRVIVWMHDADDTIWGTNDEFDEDVMAYRFSIVGDDPTDDEDFIRFGLTDESSKLNLNTATEMQLLNLVRPTVAGDEEIDPREIVNAILDWRDPDATPRSEEGDTEGKYYRALPKPYQIRNGPFDTVEELLLVKGVTGQILYGEDFDRNGLLTDNEDDDDESFPPDNEDGVLNRGLYPYLTVLSEENNVSNDNRPRVCLFGEEATLREELSLVFPHESAVVDFIVMATRSSAGAGGASSAPKARRGGKTSRKRGAGPPPGTQTREDEDADAETDRPEEDREPDSGDEEVDPTAEETAEERDDDSGTSQILSPASLLRERSSTGQQVTLNNPLTQEHLPVLLDRTTVIPSEQQTVAGLINVNTAPPRVLRCVEGLTGEQVDAIVDMRSSLSSEKKESTAWLLTEGVVDLDTFDKIAPFITARGQQFTIESLGYADHIGMVTRLQVVIDMVGPIAQTVYYRDLTYLGGHFPIREEDLERLRVR